MKTNNIESYRVKPSIGIIEPGSSIEITVILLQGLYPFFLFDVRLRDFKLCPWKIFEGIPFQNPILYVHTSVVFNPLHKMKTPLLLAEWVDLYPLGINLGLNNWI